MLHCNVFIIIKLATSNTILMKYFILIAASILLFSCNANKKAYETITIDTAISYEPAEAKALMEKHCYLCHSATSDEVAGRIAPPMIAIKARYIDMEGYNKSEFTQALTEFVSNPTSEKALMHGAVRKFGVMPKQVFPEGVAEKIAAFMYDYKIDEPKWFKAHWQGHGNENWTQSGKEFAAIEQQKTVEEIGLEYALATKELLGKNLMGTIQSKGTIEALVFCNVEAMPLTQSMSSKYNATIKRVSDKNRNPNNKANAEELMYLEKFKQDVAAKIDPKPVVIEKGDKMQFYYPIPTNSMCLQCHGKPENIKPEVAMKIKSLYPNDLATGYSENEVRGIWSISFDKE